MKSLLALTAVVLGAAAFAVPALADTPASGHVRPDDRAGVRGPGSTAGPVPNIAVRPDDRAGIRGPGAVSAPIGTPVVVDLSGPDFDWGDAGIGATAGVGLVLLLVGASRLIRHARTEPRPA